MAFNGLLMGLTKDVTGAQEGIANRKKLEQQAMHQMLADSLLKAQIGETQANTSRLQQPVKGEWTIHSDASGTYQVNSGTGEVKRIGEGQKKDQPNDWALDSIEGPDGKPQRVRINRLTGDVKPYGKAVPKGGKAPTVVERETKAAGRTALDLIGKMQGEAKASMPTSQLPIPTAIIRGGQKMLDKVGAGGMLEPAAQHFMSPKQANYQTQGNQLLHLASSVLPKGGRSNALLQNFRESFMSAAGTNNPQAAQDALEELRKQISEVLGEDVPAAGKKYHPDNPYR